VVLEIPEDLVEAIEMSTFERLLPTQGTKAIHRFLIDPKDSKAKKESTKWIETQKGLWPEVDRVVVRLHETAPVKIHPEWARESWWMTLCMPWSQDLEAAIKDADIWCDRQNDAKSS
jgi:cyclopropane fatty-acyl-phospholipid synthase-like methyltransferase